MIPTQGLTPPPPPQGGCNLQVEKHWCKRLFKDQDKSWIYQKKKKELDIPTDREANEISISRVLSMAISFVSKPRTYWKQHPYKHSQVTRAIPRRESQALHAAEMSITTLKMSLPKLPNHSFKQIQTSNLKTKFNLQIWAWLPACAMCACWWMRVSVHLCMCMYMQVHLHVKAGQWHGLPQPCSTFWERVPHWIWNLIIWTAWPASPRDPALPPQHWVCYCAWHLHGCWRSNSGLHVGTASTSLVPFPSLTIFDICVATLLKQHSP